MPAFCVIMEEKLWAVHRMVYLEKFVFPGGEQEYAIARKRMAENGGAFGYLDNGYPCGLFPQRGLSELDFEPVTIVYGGNGSGKSTILNIVAEKLGLKRLAPRNGGELFAPYCAACAYRTGYDDEGEPLAIPAGSRIVTSDDIFEYMLAARTRNEEIAEDTERGKEDYASLKYGESIRFSGWENYENFRLQVLARTKSLPPQVFAETGGQGSAPAQQRRNGARLLRRNAAKRHAVPFGRAGKQSLAQNAVETQIAHRREGALLRLPVFDSDAFALPAGVGARQNLRPRQLARHLKKVVGIGKHAGVFRIFLRQPKPVRQGIGRGSTVCLPPGLRRWRGYIRVCHRFCRIAFAGRFCRNYVFAGKC